MKKYDRFFNNDERIGHNKFVIYLENNVAKKIMTGSTNWTYTGLCGQSNNAAIIESDEVAAYYNSYWENLKTDTAQFTIPDPTSAPTKNVQGSALRAADITPNETITLKDNQSKVTVWFSPNTIGTLTNKAKTPPDLAAVYSLMRKAEDAILFAIFLPGVTGPTPDTEIMTNVITEAIAIGEKDPTLLVYGSISSPMAMPNYIKPVRKIAGEDDDEPAPKAKGKPAHYLRYH